jgi:predicted XRE-type DNA-binding protein
MTTIDPQPPCDARAEAIRANLRLALADQVKAWQVPQSTAAARLGIGRSTLNNILNHDNRRISIASLITMLLRAGADVSVEVNLTNEWPDAANETQ